MKFKGIWIVICLILMVGFTSTNYIRKITGSTGEEAYETSLLSYQQAETFEEAKEGAALTGQETFRALSREASGFKNESTKEKAEEKKEYDVFAANVPKQEKIETREAEKLQELPAEQKQSVSGFHLATASEPDGFLQNDEGFRKESEKNGTSSTSLFSENAGQDKEENQRNTALARLQELDSQIARNRTKDTEITASSQKAAAESEWRLWETELQRMIEHLKEKLDRDQQDQLMRQHREWIRSREEQAVEASQKQMGSAMEEVSYSRALAELTRERSYQIAQIYEDFFVP